MQIEIIAAVVHQYIGDAVVGDGKFKFIEDSRTRRFGTQARLDQFPSMSFKIFPLTTT